MSDPNAPPDQVPETTKKNDRVINVGCLLMALSIPLTHIVKAVATGTGFRPLFFLTDCAILLFFVGLTMMIIGLLRLSKRQ